MTSLMCMLFGHVYEGGRCTRPGCFPQRKADDMKISDGAVDAALEIYMKFPSDDGTAMRAAIEAAIAHDADAP